MKRYSLALLSFLSFSAYSQNTLNNYKYVIVPEKFEFLKQKDQYALNSLTKGLLAYKGFTVYFDDSQLPAELANNRCLALTADLLEKSRTFSTSLTLLLKDCRGNIVFESKAGTSREKEYKTAYNFALRDAFASLNEVQYAYNGSTNEPEQPIAQPAASTKPTAPVKSTATAANDTVRPIIASAPPAKSTARASTVPVKSAGTVANDTVRPVTASAAPVKSTATASTVPVKSMEAVSDQPAETLYARTTANGYQIIDTTQKIVLTLLKTSAENYFIANNAAVNGIVLKNNGDWFFEYYKDGKLVSEKLPVKF